MNRAPGPEPKPIHLSERQKRILEEIVRCRHSPQYEALRAEIILEANVGRRNQHIADKLGVTRTTVWQWRRRWSKAGEHLEMVESQSEDKELRKVIRDVMDDDPRSGCPPTFSAEQICQIAAIACECPEDSHRPVSHWTPREIADEAVERGIVPKISVRSVGRFLKSGGYKTSQDSILAQQRKRKRPDSI
jgi:putative transposase